MLQRGLGIYVVPHYGIAARCAAGPRYVLQLAWMRFNERLFRSLSPWPIDAHFFGELMLSHHTSTVLRRSYPSPSPLVIASTFITMALLVLCRASHCPRKRPSGIDLPFTLSIRSPNLSCFLSWKRRSFLGNRPFLSLTPGPGDLF